jgi:hypothetical protein
LGDLAHRFDGGGFEALKKALQSMKIRRFEFAEFLGKELPRGGEKDRLIDELLKTHETINVLLELIAEEERFKPSE